MNQSQPAVSKKTKRSPIETTTMSSNNEISTATSSLSHVLDKPSKYLKMPRRLLLHSLHLQLNCSLKKKKEQRFILSRLRIIDQQFYFKQIRYLYKNYFDLGSKQQMLRTIFSKLYNQMNLISSRNIWQITCYYYKKNRSVHNWTNSTSNYLSINTIFFGNHWSEIKRICSFTSSWSSTSNQSSNIQIT
jgi:hypothetical protein